MGLNLSSFFHYDKSNTTESNTSQAAQTTSSEGASNYRAAHEIRNMTPGQTLSGEVVAIRNGEVDIALSKDLIMTARLDRDVNIALGQTMTFEVKTVSEAQVSLRPLFENMSQNTTILNAINAAHIPLNNTSVSMVSTMMEEGMSVGKESLQNIYRQIVNNPEVSGNTIVQMNRMQIPVTPENIVQFENYKNYENSIMNAAKEVADHLGQTFDTVLQNGEQTEINKFFQQIVQIFGGEEQVPSADIQNRIMSEVPEQVKIYIVDENEGITNSKSLENNSTAGQVLQESGDEVNVVPEKSAESGTTLKAAIEQGGNQEVIEGKEGKVSDTGSLLGLGRTESTNLANLMQQAGIPEDTAALVKSGQITPEEVLKTVQELLQKSDSDKNSKVTDLLSSKEFMNLIKGQVIKQWMIQPEEVAKDGKVEELYKRIQQQTAKLAESMASFAKENSPLMKSVSNLSNNVEFMNQLNNLYTYVQLPLKMSRENAHGELYVYTNKKSLAKKDGNVSALLHLDMEHLGTMDIYVVMQNSKVSTKFYLEKEEYIAFLAEHIHILNERLEKRGYSMTSEVLLKEQKTKVIDEMINKDKANTVLSKLSFDVRA